MTFDTDFFRRRIAASLPSRSDLGSGRETPYTERAHLAQTAMDVSHLLDLAHTDEFLHQAYKVILGRECDASAFVHFRGLMRHGASRQDVLEQLCRSEEARARNVRFAYKRRRRGLAARHWTFLVNRIRTLASGLFRKSAASVARLFFWQLEVLEDKLDFLVRTEESRTGLLSRKVDNSLWLLSEKLDTYTHDLKSRIDVLEHKLGSMVTCTEVDGFIIGVPSAEWRVIGYHRQRGNMEPGLTRHFRAVVREGMTVVDAGANLGLYTLHAARLVGTTGRVHSIEPAPRTWELLRGNIQVNGLLECGIVQLHKVAVSNYSGEALLAMYSGTSGHNTLFPEEPPDSMVPVPVMTLDTLLQKEPHVDVVKIDVEGAEALVFEGMTQLLARSPNVCVLMEFSPGQLARAGTEPAGFLKSLSNAGWEIALIDDEAGTPCRVPIERLLDLWTCNLRLKRVPS